MAGGSTAKLNARAAASRAARAGPSQRGSFLPTASYAHRVIFLADGRIVDELVEPTADRVLDRMKRFDVAAGVA